MNVLFLFSTGKIDGAAIGAWFSLLDTLPARGVKPFVIVPRDVDARVAAALDKRGITWRKLCYTRWLTGTSDEPVLQRKLRRCRFNITNERADRRIGACIDEWGIELIYICSGNITAGLAEANKRGLPVVWHVHQLIRRLNCDGRNPSDTDVQVGPLLAHADAIIASCQSVKTDLRTRFPMCRNVRAVYNGVAASRIYDKPCILTEERVVFTLAASIEQNKRQLDAVRAFNLVAPSFPGMRLRFVGAGSAAQEARLKEEIAASPVAERIEFSGFADDIAQVWADTDVALNCSYSEGCSMAVAEAMCSGCLLLCSTAEGNVEVIDGAFGLLYERAKVAALAEKMRWVMQNRRQAQGIARDGKARALQMFSPQAQADAVYEVLESVTC